MEKLLSTTIPNSPLKDGRLHIQTEQSGSNCPHINLSGMDDAIIMWVL